MKNRGAALMAWVLLLLLLGPSASLSRQSGRQVAVPTVEKAFDFPIGGKARVENLSGGISVQTWSRPRVEMEVRPASGARAFRASLVSLNVSSETFTCAIPSVPQLRLDVRLRVPDGTLLELKSADGAIEVSGEPGTTTIETLGGNITLRLPINFDAEITLLAAQGSIQSELPILIKGKFDAHAVEGRVGRGGRSLMVKTTRGDIRLLALSPTMSPPPSLARAESPPPTPPRELPDREASSSSRSRPSLRTDPIEESPPPPPRRARSEDTGDVITLEAPLVNVNVSVTDEHGKAVSDLQKQDFIVYEDGVEQQVTHFSPVTAPFDLALLLDVSGSTESKLGVIRRAAQAFVDMIGPEDRMAIFAFARRVYEIAPFTNDRLLLKQRIQTIRGGGGTAFYDALWRVLTEVEQRPGRRKAIVVMTDGVDNSIRQPWLYPTEHTFEELLARVQESDVLIYPIYLDTEYEMVVRQRRESPMSYAVARRQLLALAEHSAGTLYRADTVEDLEGVYQRIADELRTIYSLAYSPINTARDGKWRTIRVKVLRPGVRVKARRGYYAR
ncbi:MAG: VWA domain-containing protein [Blastocatellia bacterium]|nr:VWA domain-containing protein [Blastocatellia bacterium]